MLMAQIAIRVEDCSRKQTISILKRDYLAAVEMPGQHQVVAKVTRGLPDARVVRAQDLKITFG
jgi:hypothetical protein